MKLFALSALFLAVTASAVSAKSCESLLPGVERMSRGVDITQLTLFPSDLSLTNGFRQSLFDFTCNGDRKWTHPTVAGINFPIPDQVSAINSIPGGALNDKTTFHQQTESYKRALSVQLGIDVTTVTYGDYSLSIGYKQVQEEILNSNQTIAEVAAYVSAVQMDFKPSISMTPNDNFQKFVTKLHTAKYEQAPQQFQDFLETFGTHYFESGVFGGYLLQQTVIDDDYRYTASDRDISANIGAKYLTMVNGKLSVDQSTNRKTTQFNEKTRTNHYYYGGSTNLVTKMSAEQFAQWSTSVPKDPWLYGGQLKNIENLIADEAVKAQVKTAVYVKKTKAYLQELKQTLVLIQRTVRSITSESQRVAELMAQTVPTAADIKLISDKVQVLVAESQAAKDRSYLQRYVAKLNSLQHYELFCKKEVANRCDHEKKREMNDAVAEASHLEAQMSSILKAAAHPDTETVRALTTHAEELVHAQSTTPISECREKLFCNLCKDVVIDLIKKEPCNTPHIKSLLRVHL